MKKALLILLVGLLWCNNAYAEDISDFQIEGMSIGESALIYFSKDELKKNPRYKICHTDEIWIRNSSRVNPHYKHKKYGGYIFDKCLDICCISPSSVIINKSIFDNVGLFDETLPVCEDYDLWLKITAKFPVLYLNEKLTIKYGGHSNQLSKKYWGMDRFRIKALENIIKNNSLNKKYAILAKHTLQKKAEIYLKGLKKRNKYKEIIFYENKIKKYR